MKTISIKRIKHEWSFIEKRGQGNGFWSPAAGVCITASMLTCYVSLETLVALNPSVYKMKIIPYIDE